MVRVRRVAAIAVGAVLGLSALAGCRSDPAVAAYVDGERISRDRVDAVYDDARVKLDKAVHDYRAGQQQDPSAPEESAAPVDMPITRQDIVTVLVGGAVLRDLAKEKGVQPAEVSPEQLEQSIRLPRDCEYAKAYSIFQGYFQALAQTVPAKDLTDADLHELFDRAERAGGVPGLGKTFNAFKNGLTEENRSMIGRAMAIRDLFEKHAAKVGAVVNPRYAPAELPLLQGTSEKGKQVKLVVLTFTPAEDAPPVVDAA